MSLSQSCLNDWSATVLACYRHCSPFIHLPERFEAAAWGCLSMAIEWQMRLVLYIIEELWTNARELYFVFNILLTEICGANLPLALASGGDILNASRL